MRIGFFHRDWQRIDFLDGFAFPLGSNLLTSVTLMAWGEIRVVGRVALNAPEMEFVSLEPGASSVAYGLTPSNSMLFAWQNACVNRDATNRLAALIWLKKRKTEVQDYAEALRKEYFRLLSDRKIWCKCGLNKKRGRR